VERQAEDYISCVERAIQINVPSACSLALKNVPSCASSHCGSNAFEGYQAVLSKQAAWHSRYVFRRAIFITPRGANKEEIGQHWPRVRQSRYVRMPSYTITEAASYSRSTDSKSTYRWEPWQCCPQQPTAHLPSRFRCARRTHPAPALPTSVPGPLLGPRCCLGPASAELDAVADVHTGKQRSRRARGDWALIHRARSHQRSKVSP